MRLSARTPDLWISRDAGLRLVLVLPAGAAGAERAAIRVSLSLMTISMSSGNSGSTSTAANEVCRVSPEPNGLMRTSRCTPISLCM